MDQQTQQALLTGYNAAPKPVQEFISSGKFTEFMQALQAKLGIHIDVADKVSNELLLVLLGLSDATELPDNLIKTGLDDELVEPVIDGVTTVVFGPLREEVLKSAAMPAPLPTPRTSQPQVPPISITAPAPAPAAWPPKPEPMPAPVVPPPPPRPEPPLALRPTPPPIPQTPPVPVPPPAPQPTMRTMVQDVEGMPNGDMPPPPKPISAPMIASPKPAAPVGMRAYAAMPARPTPTPPVVLPPPIVIPPAPTITPPSASPQTPPAKAPTISPTPSAEEVAHGLKQYGVDPYREPIEGS